MKHTFKTFKDKIRNMNRLQQETLLTELNKIYMVESTKARRGEIAQDPRVLRKKIRILKTIMKEG